MSERDETRSAVAPLRDDWRRLLAGLGVAAPVGDEVFDDLIRAYNSPDRFYHNLDHLRHVLDVVERHRHLATDPTAVALAAWFHDAIYDPRAADNEARSADLAAAALTRLGLGAMAATVARLVLLTRDHNAAPDDADGHLLLDADLSILGAGPEEYARYARAIRREYAWVEDAAYRSGRAAVLRRFLGRERIYRLPPLTDELEAAARGNLAAELKDLEGEG